MKTEKCNSHFNKKDYGVQRTGGCGSIMASESGCGGCNGNSSAGGFILKALEKKRGGGGSHKH